MIDYSLLEKAYNDAAAVSNVWPDGERFLIESEMFDVNDPALNARERTPISDSLGLDL